MKTHPKTLSDALSLVGLDMSRDRLVLFGSRAQGKASPDSDWDICVVGARHEVRGNRAVQIIEKSLRQWKSDDFYRTELAACMAVYGVPLSFELPKRSRLVFSAIRDSAASVARRRWEIMERRVAAGTTSWAELLKMKAATSALLAAEYYSIGAACPARSVLIKHWDDLGVDRQKVLESVGIRGAPPTSIDIRGWRNNIFRRGKHEQD